MHGLTSDGLTTNYSLLAVRCWHLYGLRYLSKCNERTYGTAVTRHSVMLLIIVLPSSSMRALGFIFVHDAGCNNGAVHFCIILTHDVHFSQSLVMRIRLESNKIDGRLLKVDLALMFSQKLLISSPPKIPCHAGPYIEKWRKHIVLILYL